MNTLNFPMLEIIAQSETDSLRDEGFVPNAHEHEIMVCKQWMGSKASEWYEEFKRKRNFLSDSDEECHGVYFSLTKDNNTIWVICYEHSDEKKVEVYRRAHEETHVLHAIGEIKLLQQKLDERGLDINLLQYQNYHTCSTNEKELVAHIGALYVLEKRGEDILKIPAEQNDSYARPAIETYQNALRRQQVKIILCSLCHI